MFNVVIFGAPGSGKGTQSERIIEKYGLYHISTGEVLRDHISRGTELGVIANKYISQGQLIPDELMVKVLEHLLDTHPEETAKGIILDGFPRTIAQAEALKTLMEQRGIELNAVVGLEVDEEELVTRILKRGKETGRADDNLETVKKRLAVYHNQTSPLRQYYIDDKKYHAINGNGTVDSIFSEIQSHLDPIFNAL
ncbi:MAG: adenylate kinase [Muribaculaceae bacterium]